MSVALILLTTLEFPSRHNIHLLSPTWVGDILAILGWSPVIVLVLVNVRKVTELLSACFSY
jgi:hypothetical protein